MPAMTTTMTSTVPTTTTTAAAALLDTLVSKWWWRPNVHQEINPMVLHQQPWMILFWMMAVALLTITAYLRGKASQRQPNSSASTSNKKDRQTMTMTRLSSSLPWIGRTLELFSSIAAFGERYKHYGCFITTILGRDWVFVYDPLDVQAVIRAPERTISMYQAIFRMAGKILPHEDTKQFQTAEHWRKIARGSSPTIWDGLPSTPIIARAVRPKNIRAWTPSIRALLQRKLAEMPNQGQNVDLMEWCREIITDITVQVLLGGCLSDTELKQFVFWSNQSNPEEALKPKSILSAFWESFWYGERRIFIQLRELLYPYLDVDIQAVLSGQQQEREEGDDGTTESATTSKPQLSAMSAFVHMFYDHLGRDADSLWIARQRIANDIILFTHAALINSYAMAAWVMYHVIRNTVNFGDRIHQEIAHEAARSSEDDPSASATDLVDMPDLELLIQEIARLYTPGAVFRHAHVPFQLPSAGVTIPAGAMIAIPVYSIHRHGDIFSNPHKFDPDRFRSNDGSTARGGQDERITAGAALLSFGAGTHPCVGRRFALLETALLVIEALQQFDWTVTQINGGRESDKKSSLLDSGRPFVDLPDHPNLNRTQASAIWRPVDPIWVSYQRRAIPSS